MSDQNGSSSLPPEVHLAVVGPASDELMTVPAAPDTRTLIHAFRLLQQRIPGFMQLSVTQQRSMARAAYLDPEFIEAFVVTACAAEDDARYLTGGMTGEECRELSLRITEQAELGREVTAVLKGISSSLLAMKHRLGRTALTLYRNLGIMISDEPNRYNRLRPHFDVMKRAYMKRHTARRKAKTGKAEAPAE